MKPLTLRARLALSFSGAVAATLFAFSGAVIVVLIYSELPELQAAPDRALVEADLKKDIARILLAMAAAAPIAIGGAAALGHWLAGRALSPLREASTRARAARSSALDLTLPLRGDGDAWDDLASTLNALLADGRSSLDRIRRFTADAAHELRTPLTAILGECDVSLRRERTGDELRQALRLVREDAARLTAILEALLVLARADEGTLIAGRVSFPFDAAVRAAADRALDDARRAGQSGSVQVRGSAGAALGDRVLIERALRNLIDNGLRHGGGAVEVELSAAHESLIARVKDNGPGIPTALQPALFQRFLRADESRQSGGLGLGLSIAKAIAESSGGTLSLIPAPTGAAFELRLPGARSMV